MIFFKKIIMLTYLLICQHFLFSQVTDTALISVDCRGRSILSVIQEIGKSSAIKFYIKSKERLADIKLTRPCPTGNLYFVLNNLLDQSGYTYLVYDEHIIIVGDTGTLNQDRFNYYLKKKTEIESSVDQSINIGKPDSINRSGKAIVKGLVLDGTNDSLIGGAVVRFGDENIAVTSSKGAFLMPLDIGAYQLKVETQAYHLYQSPVKVYSDGSIIIKLYANTILLPEIVVGASAKSRMESALAGIAELKIKEIKRLPSLLGEADVLKALLTLPGVSSTGEVSTGFNVRGGNIDQNLVQQDGAFFLNPSHVLGLFSAFNADAVRQVTLYKGHVPAQYGGRASSVLDIRLKEPDNKKFSFNGGVGPTSSKFFLEGPIQSDKTSFFLGGRFTYSDWILKLVKDPNLKNSKADFYDFNFKINHKITDRSSVSFTGYTSSDRFRYSHSFGYGWKTTTGTLQYQSQLNQNLFFNLQATYGITSNDFTDQTAVVSNLLENGMRYIKSKANFLLTSGNHHQINFGLDATRYLPKLEKFSANTGSDQIHSSVQHTNGEEISLYVNDEIKISDQFNLSIGIRNSLYRSFGPSSVNQYSEGKPRTIDHKTGGRFYKKGETIQSYFNPEPRISWSWVLNPEASLKWSYNRMAQYIHLISNTATSTPLDLWQMSNSFLKPQSADNYSFGYYKNHHQDEWETSAEFFYRKYQNLVDYKDFANLLRNDHIETELMNIRGKSYGAEIYIKRAKNNPNGYLSYTYSRSLRQSLNAFPDETINNGRWYNSNFDKPHNLNLVLNVQVKKTMAFAFNFVYSSGRPQTAPISDFYLGDKGVFLNYSDRNQFQIPDYHRLDISYTFTRGAIRTHKNKGSLTLAVYNVYARKNAFSVFYRRDLNEPIVAYKLAVLGTALPSITYNFQF